MIEGRSTDWRLLGAQSIIARRIGNARSLMCSCSGSHAAAHVYDAGTTVIGNLFGRSFTSEARLLPPMFCDCGASYFASMFSLGWFILIVIALAVAAGIAIANGKRVAFLSFCVASAALILAGLYRDYGRVSVTGYFDAAWWHTYLSSAAIQFAFDAIFIFAIPALLAFRNGY
jgi:hypothetical protein